MHRTSRKLKAALLAAALAGSLTACAGGAGYGGAASWKEDVLLHDGTKIIVERSQTYGGFPTIDSRERAVLEEEWTFHGHDDHRQVTWKVNQRHPPEGESLMLLQLNFLDGVPYIATSPAGCFSYNHWGRPNPPYVFFKYDGKSWQRIQLAEFPVEFKEANVVVGGRMNPKDQAGTTLPIGKVKEDNRLLEPYLRHIVREPIKGGVTSCEKRVHYKCGWFGTRPDGTLNKEFADRMCDR